MKTYNDNNIKKIVKLLEKRNRPIENLIWKGAELGIEEQEVVNSMDLLLDLGVVTTEVIDTGDGYTRRDWETRFLLVNQA